jgi:hypothetical protein
VPAWATVALALGSALIGAAAGTLGSWFGLRATMSDIAYREREAARERLIDAAEQFSRAWAETSGRLGLKTDDVGGLWATWREDERELVARGLRISILLGPGSAAHQAADKAHVELTQYARQILLYREQHSSGHEQAETTFELAREALLRSVDCHDSFLRAAHAEVLALAATPAVRRRPRWTE